VTYRILRHRDVAQDLLNIVDLIADYAGLDVAVRKLGEIEACLGRLADTPHIGSVRDEIAPGLRAIPAARKAVICFTVDDEAKEVLVMSITYAGADWYRAVGERG
jgi:plasmid stabilization system protein ParE